MKHFAIILSLALAVGAGPGTQRAETSDMRLVAELLSDVYGSETALLVEVRDQIRLDGEIVIESRDASAQELAVVKHVYDSYVILKAPLKRAFLKGSKIYQGP